MKFNTLLTLIVFSLFVSHSQAEEAPSSGTTAYIVDDLFIYMHSGAGNNYRIVGTIMAGTKISSTGNSNNGYTEIIDDKGRTTWVESKYVSEQAGVRVALAELNASLANQTNQMNDAESSLRSAQQEVTQLTNTNTDLQNQLAALNSELAQTKSQLKTQDTDILKQWFFAGAAVLIIGLLLGLLLPKLANKRRGSMDAWK